MKFSIKFFVNWRFWKMLFFWVGHFECFSLKKISFFAFFPWKQVKGYGLVRMGQNFEQAKREGTFWPIPTLLFHSPELIFHIMKSGPDICSLICEKTQKEKGRKTRNFSKRLDVQADCLTKVSYFRVNVLLVWMNQLLSQ